MVKLKLEPALALRLARYLEAPAPPGSRSDHWDHFSRLNNIAADPRTGIVTFAAGPGFDSDYEFSFRTRTMRERLGIAWRRLSSSDPGTHYAAAFSRIWGRSPPLSLAAAALVLGAPLTAHKILACHYVNLLLPHLPAKREFTYLEIGPGAGYLASLIQHIRPGPQFLVDLSVMLPYSFLTLHRTFPENPVVLPHETRAGSIRLEGNHFQFLTTAHTDLLPDASVDLAVNTASFGEMLPEQIAAYFALLRRVSKRDGLFFTSNRVEKWMGRPGTDRGATMPKIPIRFDEYPWSPGDADAFFGLSEFHALVQPQNPMYIRLCRLAPSGTS